MGIEISANDKDIVFRDLSGDCRQFFVEAFDVQLIAHVSWTIAILKLLFEDFRLRWLSLSLELSYRRWRVL